MGEGVCLLRRMASQCCTRGCGGTYTCQIAWCGDSIERKRKWGRFRTIYLVVYVMGVKVRLWEGGGEWVQGFTSIVPAPPTLATILLAFL